ncbi:hypothetical protein [Halobaculum lipolyticum]|uniref:RING-type E3 ubiquitin transferase n=1 Tax=Halobaculum lipolyticum TaxID=3032001 RepID=A0ABD5WDD9_9EURY|nr:hypothetical protein [Halobaculum sp. DT31]
MVALQSVAGVVLVVLGAGLATYTARHWRRYRAVADTPTTDLSRVEEGPVELKGTVAEAYTTAEPTIRGGPEPVVEAWEVEEWNERGDGARWKTLALGVDGGRFLLETDEGEVAVDVPTASSGSFSLPEALLSTGMTGVAVDDVAVEVARMPSVRVDPDERPSDRIRSFVHAHRDVDGQTDSITNLIDVGNAHGERKYHSQTVEVGDEVYVLGRATAIEDAPHPPRAEHMTVRGGPEDGVPMVVSTLREDRLVSRGRTRTRVAGVAAALALGAGVWLLWAPYVAGAL